VRLHTKYMSPC